VHIENIYELSEFDKWTNQQSAIRHNEPYIEYNMCVSLTTFTSYFNPSELLRYNKLLLDIDKLELEKSPDYCVFCKQPKERHLKKEMCPLCYQLTFEIWLVRGICDDNPNCIACFTCVSKNITNQFS
jgi:hypothetical protein